ncbi:hypothetical protein K435DRAFT_800340 [Dendrothele bispora CBS 962.96]|uniref:Uncharacterized protein n=1 Tax=Dendrothele bispora (strain CBS 962.96) TaxID=1314807 RepID=A0A4S8LSX3_DENBC|nr:hypothetical protein K435DRAFT_800340 [Dendrothele bispora CBS 962.96]
MAPKSNKRHASMSSAGDNTSQHSSSSSIISTTSASLSKAIKGATNATKRAFSKATKPVKKARLAASQSDVASVAASSEPPAPSDDVITLSDEENTSKSSDNENGLTKEEWDQNELGKFLLILIYVLISRLARVHRSIPSFMRLRLSLMRALASITSSVAKRQTARARVKKVSVDIWTAVITLRLGT